MPPTAIQTDAKLEAILESFFRNLVRSVGGRTLKLAPTEAGWPDRLVILPGGRIHLVELKTETGKLSPIQQVVHGRLAALGTEVVVLSGSDQIRNWVSGQ